MKRRDRFGKAGVEEKTILKWAPKDWGMSGSESG